MAPGRKRPEQGAMVTRIESRDCSKYFSAGDVRGGISQGAGGWSRTIPHHPHLVSLTGGVALHQQAQHWLQYWHPLHCHPPHPPPPRHTQTGQATQGGGGGGAECPHGRDVHLADNHGDPVLSLSPDRFRGGGPGLRHAPSQVQANQF